MSDKNKMSNKLTNKDLLNRIWNERLLLKGIIRTMVELIGHTLRHEELLKLVMKGTIGGK